MAIVRYIIFSVVSCLFFFVNSNDCFAQNLYENPIIKADFSDPDVIRVGDDYYMTASSFNFVPGLPMLHSKDLVNWTIIGYGIQKLPDAFYAYRSRLENELHYNLPRLGMGVYAPCLRYHEGFFWIFWTDPDAGVYQIKAKNPKGPWSEPFLVKKVQGWIDPAPLWDKTTGKAWLAHAYAHSRTGIKSKIVVAEMNWAGTEIISEDKVVFDAGDKKKYPADRNHFMIEGPKFMMRNGYYYLLCPAGGPPTGWQTALRAKHPQGPYEIRTICETGNTNINGPHQGGLVDTPSGEWWFLNFQSVNVLGRIIWLQPAKWENDWPVVGLDHNNDGIGNPVMEYTKPNIKTVGKVDQIQLSDEFNGKQIGKQWQWTANVWKDYCFIGKGKLYIKPYQSADMNLVNAPNIITQMFPDFNFRATAKVKIQSKKGLIRGGLSVMGYECYDIGILKNGDTNQLSVRLKGEQDTLISVPKSELFLRLDAKGQLPLPLSLSNLDDKYSGDVYCQFSYSLDGQKYFPLGKQFKASPGIWTGARLGLFCLEKEKSEGKLEVDWFHIEK